MNRILPSCCFAPLLAAVALTLAVPMHAATVLYYVVPEPGSVSLLAVAGFGLMTRRRHR